MLCVPHFKAKPNRNRNRSSSLAWNLLHCLVSTSDKQEEGEEQQQQEVAYTVCLSNNCPDRGVQAQGVSSQMLILIKINALGHVEVEKLARLTFFVAFSICLAFAWPLSDELPCSFLPPPSPLSGPALPLSEY